MADPTAALMMQLLEWVAERPRTYRETMDAWKTSCPRLTIWEDTLIAGFIEIQSSSSKDDAIVRLTESGRGKLSLK